MKVAVSNLAWEPPDDEDVARALVAAGAAGVELAPTKLWRDPVSVDLGEIRGVGRWWQERGLPVVAVQALFFGATGAQLFGDPGAKRALVNRLLRMVDVAAALGAVVLVLGAPGSRRRGPLTTSAAMCGAAEVLRPIATRAHDVGCVLCVEPNPPAYGCDFVTTAAEGIQLVDLVDSPGFGLHLDAAAMQLAEDDPFVEISAAGARLRHFHASEPDLMPITGVVDHERFAGALRQARYPHWVSLEMRPPGDAEALASSIAFVVDRYGDR